jgi:hypothetical protein
MTATKSSTTWSQNIGKILNSSITQIKTRSERCVLYTVQRCSKDVLKPHPMGVIGTQGATLGVGLDAMATTKEIKCVTFTRIFSRKQTLA